MSRFLSILTLTCFSIWILPLGAFIIPSKEKLACGGQRAICLCSHMMNKDKAKKVMQAVVKNTGSGSHKEEGSSSGPGHYYLSASLKPNNIFQNISFLDHEHFFYTCQYSRTIDHVPKA